MKMKRISTAFFIVLSTLFLTSCYELWPADWKEAEIESKWSTDSDTYQKIVEEFQEDVEKYGYKMNVRWDGIPKKYVDLYYDNADRTISQNDHVMRHRIRYTSDPEAANAELETLDQATWREDWSKVQYKNTATIVSPVWFRAEVGDCRVTDRRDRDLCLDSNGLPVDIAQIFSGEVVNHPAVIAALETDEAFDFATMQPLLQVDDYRYRVEFLNADDEAVYELSLDRATLTNLLTQEQRELIEVELEVIVEEKTKEDVEMLFILSYVLQHEFNLEPSLDSKGSLTE